VPTANCEQGRNNWYANYPILFLLLIVRGYGSVEGGEL
jgi:hypothetical protein